MRRTGTLVLALLVLVLCSLTAPSFGKANDEAQIRALAQSFQDAFNNKDLDAIMKIYAPGDQLLVFDLVRRANMLVLTLTKKTGRTHLICLMVR